jgi:hypothetical protein
MTATVRALLMLLWCMAPVAGQSPASSPPPSASVAGHPSLPAPMSAEFARRIREAVRLDYQTQADYTYIERRRDVKISRLGKVTIGPVRTFQVLPSAIPGQTYKRLIAVDDKPLSPEELAKRDAEHAADVKETQARQARETPSQRAERLEKAASEQREREAILEDAFKAYDAMLERREIVDGVTVLVARMTPRDDAPVKTREGRWMSHFEGYLWVTEADAQIVKIDMRATSDVTIGWGVVGRIHKGSRVLFVRRRVGSVWLPAETTYEATGRTLIFRPFQFNLTTTYSDYRRRDKNVTD